MPDTPRLVGAGSIFIDDIVLPDGTTYMGQVGGGVTHALMGAAIWGEYPGLSAFIGTRLPDSLLPFLTQHLNCDGLVHLEQLQARAWQIFEHDGRRHEIHRVEAMDVFVAGTRPQHLPNSYRSAQAYYLLQDFDGIRAWTQQVNGIQLWEPNALVMLPENRDQFCVALRDCQPNIVSPNLQEARMMYGNLEPDALVDALLHGGAQGAALRMGERGSIVADDNRRYYIPAVPVDHIIDHTGAGNTYCGGLLAGLVQGKGLRHAGQMAAVTASFCIETIGVVNPVMVTVSERDARLNRLA